MKLLKTSQHVRLLLPALLAVLASCSATPWHDQTMDPDRALSDKMEALRLARAEGYSGEVQRMEIERLTLVYPRHVPTLFASASLAYEARQPIKAQQYLDSLFRVQRKHPEAAVLRARIAMDEGNLSFARRFAESQIAYTPDHAGLFEVYAAVLYFQEEWGLANEALEKAEKFGAPAWRVAFHRGLIEEAAGNSSLAISHYQACLKAKPGHAEAASRLRGLGGKVPAR